MDFMYDEKALRAKMCESISFVPDIKNKNRIRIITPFIFEDGDVIKIILKNIDNEWYLTDEGHTFMHLSYDDLDLTKPSRKELLDIILRMHHITNEKGELRTKIENENFSRILFNFLQGLNKISDISFTKKDRIKTLFFQEFEGFLREVLGDRAIFDYADPDKDPNGKYEVDCYIPARMPIFIFGISTVDKCRDTTITLLKFKTWKIRFTSITIYEDQGKIPTKAVIKLSDESNKSYSNLETAKQNLLMYLEESGILNATQ
jgi:hypothetical protein